MLILNIYPLVFWKIAVFIEMFPQIFAGYVMFINGYSYSSIIKLIAVLEIVECDEPTWIGNIKRVKILPLITLERRIYLYIEI